MKNLFTVIAAVLVISCFTACGEKKEVSSLTSGTTVDEAIKEDSPSEEPTEKITLEFNPDEVKEEDFLGKWECEKMFKDGEFYENISNIPVNIMVHFEISDNHKVFSCPGIEGNEDSGTEFEWTFRDNKLIPIIDGEEAEVCYILQDGQLVANIGENNSVYFCNKVDEFTYVTQEKLYKIVYGEDATLPETAVTE